MVFDDTAGARAAQPLAELEAQVQSELEDWKGAGAEPGKPDGETDASRPKDDPKQTRFTKFRSPPWLKLK
jgi:hypothetical protein